MIQITPLYTDVYESKKYHCGKCLCIMNWDNRTNKEDKRVPVILCNNENCEMYNILLLISSINLPIVAESKDNDNSISN